MDLETFRARVGLFNLRKCVGYIKNSKLRCCRNMTQKCGKILLILEAASLILVMIAIVDVYSGGLVNNDSQYMDRGHLMLSNVLSDLVRGHMRVQNYQLKSCDWNAYMKAMNGNKTCIDVAHWNGGSSHLGKSSKGKEKLNHVRFLLSKYNLDVLGLSEANLHKSVNNLEFKIDKYKVYHQDLKIARIVTYVKEDWDSKIEESLMDPDIACIWLWIGRGKS